MKLATYKDGSRDGQLVVVSRDLRSAHFATGTATRLQQVLDDWNFLSPQLQDLYVTLNHGKARHAFAFEPRQCMAPLPRAFQWACVVADSPASTAPGQPQPPGCLAQGASDDFLGPCDDAWFGSPAWGIDFEPGLAAITGDVGMGASPEQGLDGVRLLLLANAWCLRALAAAERAQGCGPLHSRTAAAFSPVAVTPDELGNAWLRGQVQWGLQAQLNGRPLSPPAATHPGADAGAALHTPFGPLIAHLAKTRHLRAGTLIGCGPVGPHSRGLGGGSGDARQPGRDTGRSDAASAACLQWGDTVRIEMTGRDGQSVFGAIEQRVTGPGHSAEAAEAADGAETPDHAADDEAGHPSGHPSGHPIGRPTRAG